MPLLLALLRGQPVNLADEVGQCEQTLALAEEEHILPWVAHLVSRHNSLPIGLAPRLKQIQRDAAIAGFYWSSELKRILRAFEEQELVVVPLKGPFLAERLYGDTALRVSYDLDLLVARESLPQAERVLTHLGFLPGTPDDYHRQWFRGSTTVELHHDVANPLAFDFHTDAALRRVHPADFQGQRCWQLAPEDELPFLCLHAVRHRFDRLSVVVDLCFAFERMHLAYPLYEAPADAERATLLTLGAAMARQLRPEQPFIEPVHVTPEQASRLDTLADRLWHSLLTQTAEPLDWRALHAFYLELEAPGRRLLRRWRHMRILVERLIGPDYEFAGRLGFHRTWQVRLLRPLRLLLNAIHKPANLEGDSRAA